MVWIRSQDNINLVNVNFLWVGGFENTKIRGDFNSLENATGLPLGEYASEQEAMLAVDIIESFINSCTPGVLQMPEKAFSKLVPRCQGSFCNLISHRLAGDMVRCDGVYECKAIYNRGCRDAAG